MSDAVKGLGIVNEAEIDLPVEFCTLSRICRMLEIWSLVPRPLRNPACSAGSSRSRIGRSLSLMMCSRILLRWEINTIVLLFLHSLTSPFLGSVRKVEFFQSAGHLFVFQILLQRCWITFAPDSSAYLKEYSVILIKSFYDINQQILRKNGYFQNFS